MAKILAQNMFDAALYELEHLPGLGEIAVLKRKVAAKTTAPVRKTTLPAGGVGARPRTAAELQLESEKVKAEAAGKAAPSLIESTLAPFVQLAMMGVGAMLVIQILPSILEGMRTRKKQD